MSRDNDDADQARSTLIFQSQAPVSLVAALQEYLDDPNFEDNRSEYKANKDVADGKTPAAKTAAKRACSVSAFVILSGDWRLC